MSWVDSYYARRPAADGRPNLPDTASGPTGVAGVTGVNHKREQVGGPQPPRQPSSPIAIDDPLVTRLAAALMAPRPWERITDATKARLYFQAEAIRQLFLCPPEERQALVAEAEASAARRHR